MTWISLVCLLVLSGSAFGGYGSGYGSPSVGPVPKLISMMLDRPASRPILTQPVEWPSTFVQPELSIPKVSLTGYGTTVPKILPVFDQPMPTVTVLSPADQLCRGQRPETIIPIEDSRKFVVCLDDSKGVEQQCPKGLFYHPTSLRCERKLGPLEDVCASQPCLNGGQCITTDSSYQCQCAPGFDGRTCELDARVCQTQYPCGQSAEARCQSFRLGAALQYICIFQGGYGYGLSTSQVVPSPCRDIDGPQALAVSKNGFIMCDGERMHIESCPGGTIWDDRTKACVWPDMEIIPQQDQYSYTPSLPKVIPTAYAPQMDVVRTTPRLLHHHLVKNFNGYGDKMIVPHFDLPKPTINVELEQPKVIQPTYDVLLEQPKVIQPTYSVPKFERTRFIEPTYSAPLSIMKPQEDMVPVKITSPY